MSDLHCGGALRGVCFSNPSKKATSIQSGREWSRGRDTTPSRLPSELGWVRTRWPSRHCLHNAPQEPCPTCKFCKAKELSKFLIGDTKCSCVAVSSEIKTALGIKSEKKMLLEALETDQIHWARPSLFIREIRTAASHSQTGCAA